MAKAEAEKIEEILEGVESAEQKEAKRKDDLISEEEDAAEATAEAEMEAAEQESKAAKAAQATAASIKNASSKGWEATKKVGAGIKGIHRGVSNKAKEHWAGLSAGAGVLAEKVAYNNLNEVKLLFFVAIAATIHFLDISLGFIISPLRTAFWTRVIFHLLLALVAVSIIFKPSNISMEQNIRERGKKFLIVALIAIFIVLFGNAIAWLTSFMKVPMVTTILAFLTNSILVPVWIYYALLFQDELESHLTNLFRLVLIILWISLAIYFVTSTGVAYAFIPAGSDIPLIGDSLEGVDVRLTGDQSNQARQAIATLGEAIWNLPNNIITIITNFGTTVKDVVTTGVETQIEYATGDYYTGRVDENKNEPIGVYIEGLKASSSSYYDYESVFVWAILKARTLDPEKEIKIEVECSADKDTEKEVRGDADPLSDDTKFSAVVTTSEQHDLTCELPPNSLGEGSHPITFSADFNFNTMSYFKTYFMDLERKRALEREEIDPLDQYGITDKNPRAVYTNGPIMVGMGMTNSLIGISEDQVVRPRLGITIENRWEGKVKRITDLVIKTPPGTVLVACDHNIKVSECKDEEECEFGKYNQVYRLQPETVSIGLKTLVGMDLLTDLDVRNMACLVQIDNIPMVLGNAPIGTAYFKVTVDYEYELQESVSVSIKKAEGSMVPTGTLPPVYPPGDYEPTPYIPPETTSNSMKSLISNLGDHINMALLENNAPGMSNALIAAIIYQESWKAYPNNPSVTSGAGAIGYMQIMPTTGSGECGLSTSDLRDPEKNIKCGTKYIASLLNRYGGDFRKALAAYNAGPGTVSRWESNGQWQTWANAGYICCVPLCNKGDTDNEMIVNSGTDPSGARYVCQTQNYVPRVIGYMNLANQIYAEEIE